MGRAMVAGGGFELVSHTCTSLIYASKEQSVQVSDTTILITAPSARHQNLPKINAGLLTAHRPFDCYLSVIETVDRNEPTK